MSSPATLPTQDYAGIVFDTLEAHPEGRTVHDLAEAMSMPVRVARRAVRQARMILAEDDTIFILAEPQGAREPWLYKLVDGAAIVNMEESAWVVNRIHDAQSRIQLIHAAMRVAQRATDGRSTEGRKARVLARATGRLIEDLEEIDLEG